MVHKGKQKLALTMRNAWGQYFRNGTFPDNTIIAHTASKGPELNVINISNQYQFKATYEKECATLDKALDGNYRDLHARLPIVKRLDPIIEEEVENEGPVSVQTYFEAFDVADDSDETDNLLAPYLKEKEARAGNIVMADGEDAGEEKMSDIKSAILDVLFAINSEKDENDTPPAALLPIVKPYKSPLSCDGEMCTITTPDGADFVGMEVDGVIEFRGISYALPPTGARRFKSPVLMNYSDVTITAIQYAKKCATHRIEADQDEDCLTVNIAVSKSAFNSNKRVPIVYYIHGGGFDRGSNQIDLTSLAREQNVMVISIAYRLGIWGFLHLPEVEAGEEFQGNWGLLDIIGAMEWSQTYAPYFHGDVDQATISGCSSGAEAIWWLLTTEKAWPYYQRANIMGMGLNTVYTTHQGQVILNFIQI